MFHPDGNPVSARRLFPGDLLAEFLERGDTSGPRARLEALAAEQLEEFPVTGWHCGFPRCLDPVGYLSSLKYATRTGGERQRGRFLCDRHARNFAVRHGLDVAAALSPEGNSR